MSKRIFLDFSNTCFGTNALDSTFLGANNNCSFGTNSLTNNSTGSDNSAFGYEALISNITGTANSCFGSSSFKNLTSGMNNLSLGYNNGNSIISGNRNIFIGSNCGNNIPNNDNDILVVSNSSTKNLIYGDMGSNKIGFCYSTSTGALSGDISIDGESDKIITLERGLTSIGRNFIVSAGGAPLSSNNCTGGDLILRSGLTTGTGASKIVLSLSDRSTTISNISDNTFVDRFIVCPPKLLSITVSTAVQNPLFILNIPVGRTIQGGFDIGINITTSTPNYQSYHDTYMFVATNKAGTITSNFSNFGSLVSQTSGTFVMTMTVVNGTNNITVRPTINPGAIVGTIGNCWAYMTIRNNSNCSITLL